MSTLKEARRTAKAGAFDPASVGQAIGQAFKYLESRRQLRNPVMFVVWVGTLVTLYLALANLFTGKPWGYDLTIALLLLLTVLFANFAEALAEARGRAQAASLRTARADLKTLKLVGGGTREISSTQLRKGDQVLIKDGQFVPADGEIRKGLAVVDESAITGESAPGDYRRVGPGGTGGRNRPRRGNGRDSSSNRGDCGRGDLQPR